MALGNNVPILCLSLLFINFAMILFAEELERDSGAGLNIGKY